VREAKRVDGELRVARVFGAPVLITPSWWLGALVITVVYLPVVHRMLPVSDLAAIGFAVTLAVLLGASVLAHELGHCLMAQRLGLPVRRVRLFLLGGESELVRPPTRPREDALIAAAGPALSIVVALLAALGVWVAEPRSVTWLLALELAVANAAIAVFNLLPGLPLDGGQLLRAGVWLVTGRRGLGTSCAAFAGVVVGVALIGWGLYSIATQVNGAWLRFGVAVLMAWFVLAGALAELRHERRRNAPVVVPLDGLVQPVLPLPAESPIGDALAAAAGRGVLLVRPDGTTVGLLDPIEATDLAARAPLAPADKAARPVHPEAVLQSREVHADTAAVLERVQGSTAWQFLVVDDGGRPTGVLRRVDVYTALAGQPRR
jgi:Zn-dependent protease